MTVLKLNTLFVLLLLAQLGCVSGSDLYVGDHLTECVGVGPRSCTLTRTSPTGEWLLAYDGIEDFEYQWGYEYHLLISESSVSNPPADGSSIKQSLVEIVEKKKVSGPFDIQISFPSSLTKSGDSYKVFGRSLTCKADNCDELDTFLSSSEELTLVLEHPHRILIH